jgi:hypothetical protein
MSNKFSYEKEKLQLLARQKAKKYGIDEELFLRQINQESGFRPSVKSGAGAIGLGQIMPGTAKGWGVKQEDLLNPEVNLDLAAKIMQKNLKTYNNDYTLALAAYNGGAGAINFVKKNIGRTPTGQEWIQFMSERRKKKGDNPVAWHTQTLGYVNKIMPPVVQNMEPKMLAQEAPAETTESKVLSQQESPSIRSEVNPDVLNQLLNYFSQSNQNQQQLDQRNLDTQNQLEALRKSLADRELANQEMNLQAMQHQQMLNQQLQEKAKKDNLLATGQSAIQSLLNAGQSNFSPVQLSFNPTQNATPQMQQINSPWSGFQRRGI